MSLRLKSVLVFGDVEGYFGVKSKIKMIITDNSWCTRKILDGWSYDETFLK